MVVVVVFVCFLDGPWLTALLHVLSGGAARGVVDALAEHVFNDELRKYGERKEKAPPPVFQGSL